MKIGNLKSKIFYIAAVGLSIFCLFFVITCVWIGYEVKSRCQEAVKEYHRDCLGSLILLLDDKNQPFRQRNSAIWALGQLGNRRALPVLKSYYTGNIPPREPLNRTISQYELKKAINLAGGGFNLTAIFWRHGIDGI